MARDTNETTDDPLKLKLGIYTIKRSRTIPKASIAISLKNIPGAIFKMASCFAFRDMDIVKIESRPATVCSQLQETQKDSKPFTQKHWDLVFYVDYEPKNDPEVNSALLKNLMEYSLWIRPLGLYTSGLSDLKNEPAIWDSLKDVLVR